MKSKSRRNKAHRQMIETAANQFQRTGHLPPLRVRENAATGETVISWLPDDCENGMHRTVRRIPTHQTKPNP